MQVVEGSAVFLNGSLYFDGATTAEDLNSNNALFDQLIMCLQGAFKVPSRSNGLSASALQSEMRRPEQCMLYTLHSVPSCQNWQSQLKLGAYTNCPVSRLHFSDAAELQKV
jgi:hypothetical protein